MSNRRTRMIDPETGSYVHEDGAWRMDDTGFSQIYQAIMTKPGTVPSDTDMGNRLWLRTKMQSNMATLLKKDMQDAVQHLIDQVVIESFQVVYSEVNGSNPNRLDYGWAWTAGGEEFTYDGSLAVGSG